MSARHTILIRDAVPGDLASVVDFNLRLAAETEGKTLDRDVLTLGATRALREPELLRYWVAEAGGRLVGQAAVTREWSDWRNGWIWWFQSVYVDVEFRRLGVFRALHRHVRQAALTEGDVIGLRLYVEAANSRAQATYRALGMVPGGYDVYEELWPERFKNRPE